METPVIRKEHAELLLDKRFLRLYDLQYAPGKHYFVASRRKTEELAAVKTEDEFKTLLPDAVSCFVILLKEGDEPRLLLTKEYRYALGRFVLSVPAGLVDPKDAAEREPLLTAAAREIYEETGLRAGEGDRLFTVSPCCFSTPGMTDESNGLVCAVCRVRDYGFLTDEHTEGTELFSGFELVSKETAKRYLASGRDGAGLFYSMYTWAGLMYFISGLWEEAQGHAPGAPLA